MEEARLVSQNQPAMHSAESAVEHKWFWRRYPCTGRELRANYMQPQSANGARIGESGCYSTLLLRYMFLVIQQRAATANSTDENVQHSIRHAFVAPPRCVTLSKSSTLPACRAFMVYIKTVLGEVQKSRNTDMLRSRNVSLHHCHNRGYVIRFEAIPDRQMNDLFREIPNCVCVGVRSPETKKRVDVRQNAIQRCKILKPKRAPKVSCSFCKTPMRRVNLHPRRRPSPSRWYRLLPAESVVRMRRAGSFPWHPST